jgi:predicted HTH transcriptional regulator
LLGENHLLKNREMHVLFIDPVNDPVKVNNDLVNDLNDSVKSNIMQHLKQNSKANYKELAEKTGYSVATIKRHIQELKKMGKIDRIGSDKTGYWKVNEQ